MKTTERTHLLRPSLAYVEFSGLHGNRKIRLHKLRCCLYATFITIMIMIMVGLINYLSMYDDKEESSPNNETSWDKSLKLSYDDDAFLPPDELNTAIQYGNEAIRHRYLEDLVAKELPSPSPSSRHQYAVNTGSQAKRLSFAAVGELAATKKIEELRMHLGMPSAFGRHFDVGWVPKGGCKEYSIMNCTSSKYRTFDGTCNQRNNYGAAYTMFRRLLPPDYANGIDSPRVGKYGNELPSARDVSLRVHKPSQSTNPSFTVMVAVFGQFIDHDITATAISQGAHGKSLSCCGTAKIRHPECFPVKIGKDDPNYRLIGSTCMEFVRSAPAPQCKIGPRQQLNQATAFIDGSVIYGSDIDTSLRLRKRADGLMKMIVTSFNTTLLPPSKNVHDGCNREQEIKRGRYCFDSGDKRANENLHLTTMHVIWARQHNLIARKLKEINPSWGDEEIFQETRRIVVAQLQHITYNEFLPIILGDNVTGTYDLKPLKSGFRERTDADANPSVANSFAAAAFRFAHTLLPGLMKEVDVDDESDTYISLHRIFFNPYELYSSNAFDSTIKSVISTPIQKTSTHVTSELSQHLFEDNELNNTRVSCGLDLVSLNIQRGRDHGLPGYTKWREYCFKSKPKSFDDLKDELDGESLKDIANIYNNIDDVDLYTGALAEKPILNGLVGPTFSYLLTDQFVRLQQGDRYWYEFEGEDGSFTEEQLNEIRKTSLAKVICDCSDNITELQPQVMLVVNKDNSFQDCGSFPGINLSLWKEK